MSGYVNIFDSRRVNFEKCRWWRRKVVTDSSNGEKNLAKVAHHISPDGFFYAEEVQSIAEAPSASGDIRYTKYTVTISTNDDVYGKIHQGDLIEYKGRIWFLENISFQPEWKRSQFKKYNDDGTKVFVLVS